MFNLSPSWRAKALVRPSCGAALLAGCTAKSPQALAFAELTQLLGLGARFNQQEEVSRLLKTL